MMQFINDHFCLLYIYKHLEHKNEYLTKLCRIPTNLQRCKLYSNNTEHIKPVNDTCYADLSQPANIN